MNCVNHPEVAAAAYCQNCGKPLCTGCMRSVGGVIYCEPCLAARLSPPPQGGNAYPDANLTGLHAHPVLAGLLGFIPGVGAMYNGQYIKALAHVLIFAVFVSLSDKSFVFGLLLAAWIFYQVFDAAQTAKARRDGLPLPNPFGLNDLGTRLGMAPTPGARPMSPAFPPARRLAAHGYTRPVRVNSAQAPVRVRRSRLPIPRPTACPRRPALRARPRRSPARGPYSHAGVWAASPLEPAEHEASGGRHRADHHRDGAAAADPGSV